MAIKSRRIGEQVDSNTLGRVRVENLSGFAISAGDILSVVGTNSSAGFLRVQIAKSDAVAPVFSGMKLVAAHDIADGSTGIAVSWKIVREVDTFALVGGAGTLGALLFLSDSGTTGNTVATSQSGSYQATVGQVLTESTGAGKKDGVILLAPPRY